MKPALLLALIALMLLSFVCNLPVYPGAAAIFTQPTIQDSEGLLAVGKQISLSTATHADLELIPGLPQNIIEQLLFERHALVQGEIKLEDIRGIGPARAKLIKRSIALR